MANQESLGEYGTGRVLRIGTRGSALALAQTRQTAGRLERAGLRTELVVIKTSGDRMAQVSLAKVGGKGLFIKELEEALLDGRVDVAIHSMKDVPAELPAGFGLGAVPAREDVADVLVTDAVPEGADDAVAALPAGARVGTGSLRRRAQLAVLRPDIEILPLRGNIDTRVGKVRDRELDAVVLAQAGMRRLGVEARRHRLPVTTMLPAVGQGALALEIRAGDEATRGAVSVIHDAAAADACAAERGFTRGLDASCTAPVAALAAVKDGRLHLEGLVASLDGATILRGTREGASADAADVGAALARDLIERGAAEVLAEVARQIDAEAG